MNIETKALAKEALEEVMHWIEKNSGSMGHWDAVEAALKLASMTKDKELPERLRDIEIRQALDAIKCCRISETLTHVRAAYDADLLVR